MIRRTQKSDTESAQFSIRQVLAQYGFSDESVELVVPIRRRLKNVNFRVRAAGADWVVKCAEATDAEERLAFTHAFEFHVGERGFPVAGLQRTRSGASVVRVGQRCYTLHPWVVGRHLSTATRDSALRQRPQLLDELAADVGRLHRVSREFTPAEPPAVLDVSDIARQPYRFAQRMCHERARVLSRVSALRLKPRKSDFDRWVLRTLPEMYEHAERLASEDLAGLVVPGDVIVVHNDINWENLVLDDSFRLRALLDFDNSILAPRALDIGAAAVTLAGPRRNEMERFAARCLDASEMDANLELVGIGMHLKCVRSILWSFNAYLGNRVGDVEMLQTWCSYLYDCLGEIASRPRLV